MDNDNEQQTSEHAGQYFMNRNIFKSGIAPDDQEYSRLGKTLWLFVPLIIAILMVAAVIALTQSFLAGIPATIVCAIAYLWIIRKMVFDENQYKRLIANNELNKEMQLSYFNNVLNIADDNQVFFQVSKKGLASAFFVTFDYASLIDESEQANANTIRQALVPFIKQLHDNHFDFNLYDVAINSTISPGTLNLIKRAKKYLVPESWLQLVEMLQNETMSSLEQNNSAQYRMYFEVINSDPRNVTNFKGILEDMITSTLSTSETLINPHIATLSEIINFNINYYQIPTFNIKDRNLRKVSIERYFKFVSFFDVNGEQYSIDTLNPEFGGQATTDSEFNVERQANVQMRNDISKKKRNNQTSKNQQEKQQNRVKKEEALKAQKMFKQYGIIAPHSVMDKNYQKEQRQAELQKRQQQRQQQQIKNTKKMQDNNRKQENDISLNDLLNKM